MTLPPRMLRCDTIFLSLTYFAWCSLALFLFTSTTLSASYFIFMLPPGLYYTYHWLKDSSPQKTLPKSAWAALAMSLCILISQLINSPEMGPLTLEKLVLGRYAFIAFLSIAPTYQLLSSSYLTKKKKCVLWGLALSTSLLANGYGLLAWIINYDFLSLLPTALNFSLCERFQYKNCGLYNGSAQYAGILQLLIPISMSLALYHKKISSLLKRRNFMLCYTIIGIIALYTAYSRSALFSLFITGPLVLIYWKKKVGIVFYVVSALIIFLWFISINKDTYSNSYNKYLGYYTVGLKSYNNLSRLSIYQAALSTFKDRPLQGIGYKNFKQHSLELQKKYSTIKEEKISLKKHHTHNSFLEMLVGCGIFGFFSIFAFSILWFKEILSSHHFLKIFFLPPFITFWVTTQFHNFFMERTTAYFAMGMYSLFQALRLIKDRVKKA